jgi:hypothetical protein
MSSHLFRSTEALCISQVLLVRQYKYRHFCEFLLVHDQI